jgi:hypothetical protein
MKFEHYITKGTPFAPDSFLIQGEWHKFKNISEYFLDQGFGQHDIIDDLECENTDYQNTIEELEEEIKGFEKFQSKTHDAYIALFEEIVNFDILEIDKDEPEMSKENLIKLLDKTHQKWYNMLQIVGESIADIIDQPEEIAIEKK